MPPAGRFFIILGAVLIVVGIALTFTNFFSWLRLGRLPGDIIVKRGNFSFYFPVVTCLLLSLFLTLIFFLARK